VLLKSKLLPFSSVVGGGLTLVDENGCAHFIVNFMGTTNGISRAQSDALAKQLDALISRNILNVPDFPNHESMP
jgi:hypothetical protein